MAGQTYEKLMSFCYFIVQPPHLLLQQLLAMVQPLLYERASTATWFHGFSGSCIQTTCAQVLPHSLLCHYLMVPPNPTEKNLFTTATLRQRKLVVVERWPLNEVAGV